MFIYFFTDPRSKKSFPFTWSRGYNSPCALTQWLSCFIIVSILRRYLSFWRFYNITCGVVIHPQAKVHTICSNSILLLLLLAEKFLKPLCLRKEIIELNLFNWLNWAETCSQNNFLTTPVVFALLTNNRKIYASDLTRLQTHCHIINKISLPRGKSVAPLKFGRVWLFLKVNKLSSLVCAYLSWGIEHSFFERNNKKTKEWRDTTIIITFQFKHIFVHLEQWNFSFQLE